ncbi:histidine phosphatase family protein [Neobacillus sp. FSL H8-0543]|uniref:histidine phosphatase family protein n=1 Tax=Neobacillus sp. FSL H8-0543 TaxID=2954672 RepID=UPI00315862BF
MGTCVDMDLFLVRHGITDWNQQKRYLGHTDRSIINSELDQLEKLQKELTAQRFDHAFTSDLRRCQETLAYLNIPAPISVDARLRELNFGDWEGKTYNELKDEKTYQDWLDNWEHGSIPNGESSDAFKNRLDSFLQDLFKQSMETTPHGKKQFLLMTHGGVIRYLVSRFVPSMSFWDLSVSHGQGIRLTLLRQKEEWVCNSLLAVPSQEKGK